MDGDFDSPFGNAKLLGQLPQRRGAGLTGEEDLQHLEVSELARGLVFLAQLSECAVEQCEGPAALENPSGRAVIGRLAQVALFAIAEIDRKNLPTAAALLGRGLVPLLRSKAGNGGQQERTKAAALRIGVGQIAFLQEG